MKVLLTGAAGFVGSFVLNELLILGHRVAIVLKPGTDSWRIQSLLNQCHIIEQDLQTFQYSLEAIDAFAPEALIHMAWYGVTNDKRNESAQLKINIRILEQLFEVVRASGIKTFIGLGSQAEYGPANYKINERQLTQPTTLYGVAKLAAYHWLKVMCQQHDIRFIWHRLFSAYGPKDHPSWFIPYLIKELMRGQIPALTKGTQLWDFVFVQDAARAIVKTLITKHASGVFNLGSGHPVRIRTVAETLAKNINTELVLEFGKVPFRGDQVTHLEADISRLQEEVSWKPSVLLQDGLIQTIEWFRANKYA